jgi:dTDP-4-dehydrorhamnose 3,5-epimerase
MDKPTLIKSETFMDSRGVFFEACKGLEFVQDNISISHEGVVRGLHYQVPPFEQGKLIRVLRGSIYDVAVNLETKEIVTTLLNKPEEALFIPPNYAHGFQALTPNTLIYYKCTKPYSKGHERGFNPLSVYWKIPVTKVSEKDKSAPWLSFTD